MAEEKLPSRPMSPRPAKVVVRFDQQQLKLLEFLRAEGTFGAENGEIIRNVVLDYLDQQKRHGGEAQADARRQLSRRSTAPRRTSGKVAKRRSKR